MKTDKSDILTLLRNSEDYVSGQQLCDRFGVTRTAVWKVINQLKEEGYQIESVTGKGYRLTESPADVLSASEIASRLTTGWAGRNYIRIPYGRPCRILFCGACAENQTRNARERS